MYKSIMIPVDLAHAEQLDKALATAADLARHYGAQLHMVGVTDTAPSSVAHDPVEFAAKLAAFAQDQSKKAGVTFHPKAMTSPDLTIDLDEALQAAIEELGCDLVVMASHVPGLVEYIFASRAGYLASHAMVWVFVVR